VQYLPPFFRDLVAYASPATDAPDEFIITTALPVLGTALGRQFYVQWGSKRLYPNIYETTIAPSTIFHKSYSFAFFE